MNLDFFNKEKLGALTYLLAFFHLLKKIGKFSMLGDIHSFYSSFSRGCAP